MNVAFRADASTQIGTGHFMRCLTLAEELKNQGANALFLSRNLPLYLSDMLVAKEIEYIPLNNDDITNSIDELAHARWLAVSQAQDAKATVRALSGRNFDWIIVDHYALDFRWESIVRPNVKKIMVIDDLADRSHDCDILLDQNCYLNMQTRYNGKVPVQCQLLLGPHYAILREEFRAVREQIKIRNGDVKKILVFFGGVDQRNYTLKTMAALAAMDVDVSVDVVIGAQHPFVDLIKDACANYGFICHVQTISMAKLMMEADLAIGAGGSASWERCCLGLPAIIVAFAENQIEIASGLASVGACDYLLGELSTSYIQERVRRFLMSPASLQLMSCKAHSLVDGWGAKRVREYLYEK
ncbi:UDP-2,4-diacetamido-2,4,6-trideoxy-beta-L-altropyranose hydrolase [Polynucleobacter sp. AM-26B4]|uniref:UDP-2,4-diacetamido-2,4, 6-trideoxy-beta-L-altropyranose hydrolase n=1 Tax=Polynucleobacter sp. AM-26B4 TaxID=2689103 RepID=UPI001C0ACECA|nr:UDP-2,4-diacetamido-2,4,6-trideoxy-beta-L-altropyranose hydrolase [Polynucleobacter sp. AM-26B4]MBU3585140.1 UDP-2,4-diacetamido-2,4,6-trideoxy-beta-L-altropyranose hydrolase [Polynucleobacter sp. AM-26B4]